jgi:hypothetical protein
MVSSLPNKLLDARQEAIKKYPAKTKGPNYKEDTLKPTTIPAILNFKSAKRMPKLNLRGPYLSLCFIN